MVSPLRALLFSPTAPHPPFRGNRQRMIQFAELLNSAGFSVSLAVGANRKITPEAEAFWDEIFPLKPAPPWRPSTRPSRFDSWYRDGLGEALAAATSQSKASVVIFNYVFHSRALEYLPPGVETILDTHEVFSSAHTSPRSGGLQRGFFSCSEDDERRYLDRANRIVAISHSDARGFAEMGVSPPISHIPFALTRQEPVSPLRTRGEMVWGMAMSANDNNLVSLRDFINEVTLRFGHRPPFRLHIAGDINKLAYKYFPHRAHIFRRDWIRYLGQISDMSHLYQDVSGIIVPVTQGSGMAIKFAHPLAYGMPVISTSHGARGSASEHPFHNFRTNAELVAHLEDFDRDLLTDMSSFSLALHQRLSEQVNRGWKSLSIN